MRDLRAVLALAALVGTSVAAAAPVSGPRVDAPRRVNSAIDGAPVYLVLPADGRTVAAWAYRSAGEFDLAVSIRGVDGRWSEPAFFGQGDRLDQTEPALAVDATGHAYLAFATRPTGEVSLAILLAGSEGFTPAMPIVPAGSGAASPALRVVGDRLVVGWREGRTVQLADLPLVGGGNRSSGVQDGPDGFNPLGSAPPRGNGMPTDPEKDPGRKR